MGILVEDAFAQRTVAVQEVAVVGIEVGFGARGVP
jgi:hypothetical protein